MDASEFVEELARLRAEVQELRAGKQRAGLSRRRLVTVSSGVLLAVAMVTGVAGATTGSSTTDVAFVTIPSHNVLSNVIIGGGGARSAVVIGGFTTVPTNATTVRLNVSVHGGTSNGTMNFYPAGNPAGASGQTLSWNAHQSVFGTVMENVGTSNQVTFANNSTGAVTVTAAVNGYSTQVTAGDISGSGGTTGQVLTNTGSGAAWQTMGQGFTNSSQPGFEPIPAGGIEIINTVGVPGGSYLVTWTGFVLSQGVSGRIRIQCQLTDPGDDLIASGFVDVDSVAADEESISLQAMISTFQGTITAACTTNDPFGYVGNATLNATQVSSVSSTP